MIFPSCIWDIWMNPSKRNLHQRNEKSENSWKRKKSEVINHFSSRNCSLIKYLCLRWRMAIFHYLFIIVKLSTSFPLLSLIISFINLDQGSPFILKASTRKVLSKSWTIKFWCSKKKYRTHPAESENVQTQEKHKQEKKWERILAENGAPEIAKEDRRTKVKTKSSTWWSLVQSSLKHILGLLSFLL